MEKQANANGKLRFGFLIFYIFFTQIFFGNAQEIFDFVNNFKLDSEKESQKIFCGEVCEFSIFIPGIFANQIFVEEPKNTDDVKFYSLKKIETQEEKKLGTKIFISLIFLNAGEKTAPPILVKFFNAERKIFFPKIFVQINPSQKIRKAKFFFDDDFFYSNDFENSYGEKFFAEIGTPHKFSIELFDAKKIETVLFEIPKDFIFSQSENFRVEKNCIVTFNVTPLKIGKLFLPKIKITASDEDDFEFVFESEKIKIDVKEKSKLQNQNLKNQTKNHDEFFLETITEENFLKTKNENHFDENFKIAYEKLNRKIFFPFLKNRYGIFLGGKIFSVPEEKSTTLPSFKECAEIKILKKNGEWLFVKSEGHEGWCKKEQIWILKKF